MVYKTVHMFAKDLVSCLTCVGTQQILPDVCGHSLILGGNQELFCPPPCHLQRLADRKQRALEPGSPQHCFCRHGCLHVSIPAPIQGPGLMLPARTPK